MHSCPSSFRSARLLPLLFLTLMLGAPPARAQTEAFVVEGDCSNDNFGLSVDGGGDVNADGVPDFIVGGYRGCGIIGRIKVCSGLDGSLLHLINGTYPGAGIGRQVEFAGDVNNDGYDDFIGIGLSSPSRVYSGLDASVLYQFTQQDGKILAFGDANQDGHADLLVGTELRSGLDGSLLRTFIDGDGYTTVAGDLNADGVRDLIWTRNSPLRRVRVYSGLDDSLLYEYHGLDNSTAHGVGDVNADGFSDFCIVSIVLSPFASTVMLYSGFDGSLLRMHESFEYPFIPISGVQRASAAGDFDGDGHGDYFLASTPPRLVSGRTGCTMAEFVRADGNQVGYSIALAGDGDGDGWPDVIVGNPQALAPGTLAGTAVLFRFDGVLGTAFCASTPNSTGGASDISAYGSLSITVNDLSLCASNLPAGQPGIFYYGDAQIQVPFGNGLRCVGSAGSGVFRLDAFTPEPDGTFVYELDNTAPPQPGGQLLPSSTWNFQAWFRDPAGGNANFDLSNGLSLTFVP